jgi:hypothetical protein
MATLPNTGVNNNVETTNSTNNNTTAPRPGVTPKPDTRKKIKGTSVPDGTNQVNNGFLGAGLNN